MYGIYICIYIYIISRVYMICFDYHSYVMIIIVIVVIIVVVVVVVVIIIVVVVSFSGLNLNWSMQFWGIQEKHSWLVTSSGTCFWWNLTCLPQESHFSPTTILMYRKQQARQPVLSKGSEQKLDWQETVDPALNPRSLLLNSIQWEDVGSVQDGSFAFICYVLCFCIFEVAMAPSWELGLGMKFQAEFQIESISLLLQAVNDRTYRRRRLNLAAMGQYNAGWQHTLNHTEPQNGVPVGSSCSHVSGSWCRWMVSPNRRWENSSAMRFSCSVLVEVHLLIAVDQSSMMACHALSCIVMQNVFSLLTDIN